MNAIKSKICCTHWADKKATISSALVDFVGYGIFIIILLVFFFLFKLSVETKTNEITEVDFREVTQSQILLNYLRTPVIFEGQEMPMADLIGKNPKDYKLIQQKTEPLFKDLEDRPYQVLVNINNEYAFDCGTINAAACAVEYGTVKIQIPNLNGNMDEVSLCFWTDDKDDAEQAEYECRKRRG